jgi:hypothetical protein
MRSKAPEKMVLQPKYIVEVSPVISMMLDNQVKLLPVDYRPNEYDVICGRGRGVYRHTGNMKFHALLVAHIPEYQTLQSKIDKTTFFNKMIDLVRSQNNGTTRFVRRHEHNNHMWEELSDDQIRDKVKTS